MAFAKHDIRKNQYMLTGKLRRQGYDWWWHSFTGKNAKTGEEKAFFVEYFLCNPDLKDKQPVLGQLPKNKKKGRKPSYCMVKAGCWGKDARQLHRFFSWDEVRVVESAPYQIYAGDCYASEERISGSVEVTEQIAARSEYMTQAGAMSWKLLVDKVIPYNVGYGTSGLLRSMHAFEMYWHAEGMKTRYEGEVWLDGEQYIVSKESSYGYADKNWGSNFTSPWIWLSSNHLISRRTGRELANSVFDIGGGRPKVFFVPFPKKLLGAFYYEGREYEYNFSKFWQGSRTKFRCYETDTEIIWKIRQENKTSVMMTRVRCCKEDMLLVQYEAPTGEKRHNRLWNGGNATGEIKLYAKAPAGLRLIDIIDADHIGCEWGEFSHD